MSGSHKFFILVGGAITLLALDRQVCGDDYWIIIIDYLVYIGITFLYRSAFGEEASEAARRDGFYLIVSTILYYIVFPLMFGCESGEMYFNFLVNPLIWVLCYFSGYGVGWVLKRIWRHIAS